MRGHPSCCPSDFPADLLKVLKARHGIIQAIRAFFDERCYIEVETPLRVKCPCIDPYIDAFETGSGYYLSTSPEFHMKRLLALDLPRMYQITRAFRAEEEGRHHNPEFTLLEWYRKGADYIDVMAEAESLIAFILKKTKCSHEAWTFPFPRIKVSDLYNQIAGWDPCRQWDEDRYFRDWAEKIETHLYHFQAIFLIDFPAPLASLAKIKQDNSNECERFELFLHGLETGNAFSELIDYDEHVKRFKAAGEKRTVLHKTVYPSDISFLSAIKQGIPKCGGIAIGVDRLVMAILGYRTIDMVQAFPAGRL